MMAATVAACTAGARPCVMAMQAAGQGEARMYGLIGKMTATHGQRDELIAILLEGTTAMPGCLSYVVAADPADVDAIWITEVWDSEASHTASLQLPAVQAAIVRARPLIAGFSNRTVTTPVGGVGLAPSR
jgi:quinol monooxygenase YgiN